VNHRKPIQKISEMGERKVIELLVTCLEKTNTMWLPFGDDVSAIPISKGLLAVLKTDMLVGKTDIPPGMTLRQAARKAVVINISDFAAKGVKPMVILSALGLRRNMDEFEVQEIGKGLNDGAREYGAFLVGGDTGETEDLIICCMVFGTSLPTHIMSRSGARPGDILAVTGHFSKSTIGLKVLLEGLDCLIDDKHILEAVYSPKARLCEGIALGSTGYVSSSIDSSDGLAVSLHELSKRSHVGFVLNELPIAKEVKNFADIHGLDETELSLYGGEEYELVLTVRSEGWTKAQKAIRKVGGELMAIGEATENKDIVFRKDKLEMKIQCRGWEHFKS